jgi:outer membrane protein
MVLTRAGLASLALFAFGAIFGPAQAQQAPPAAPPGLSVLVVDIQALLQNSKSAKMVSQQIAQKRNEYQKEMSQQEETLRKERDALQHQQASLSQEAFSQKGREWQQKLNDFDRNMQTKRQILEKANTEGVEKIQETALKIITDLAKERKANIVFLRNMLVLYSPEFDVTDDVLQKLDEQLPTLTVNFVAPTASNEPAAAAAAPAKPAQPEAPPKKKK